MSEEELRARVKTWLENQGYPLEMRVADIFARRDYRVIQSEYYSDSNSGQQREIDVFSYMQKSFNETFLRLALCVECKSEKSKPWIVFVSAEARLADPARVSQRCSTMMGFEWLRHISKRSEICSLPIFLLPEQPGYGLTAAFSSGPDVPYAAMMSAVTAAESEANEMDRSGRLFLAVHFPVVVIEAPLFTCSLTQDEGIQLTQADSAVVAWRNPVARRPHSIVHVIRASALEKFANQTAQDFSSLLENTKAEVAEVLRGPFFKSRVNRKRASKASRKRDSKQKARH